MNISKKIFFIGALFVGGLFLAHDLRASYLQNTIGWIWGGSDDVSGGMSSLGWVSLNSRDCDENGDGTVDGAELAAHPACPPGPIVDYGVNIPETGDGPVTGYGWSEHYGWISFNAGDVAGCPTGSCAPQRVGNRLAGWARILSIRDGGANAGGWTGFIKLSSDSSDAVSYGITISGKDLSGYAYSDELGWTDFATAKISPPNIFHVCENSCSSTFLRGREGSSSSYPPMSQNTSRDLVACFNSTGDCTDSTGDITGTATWTETDAPENVVTLSDVSGKKRVTAGSAIGTENFSASYNGKSAAMTASVYCIPTNSCVTDTDADQVCEGEEYQIDNGCGVQLTCDGVRTCDDNWTEVAP